MATERLDIIVSERGSRVVKRELQEIGTQARATGSAVGALRQAFIVAGLGVGVQQLIELADAYTTIRNRARLAVGPTGDVNATLDRLFTIANQTQQPMEAITTLFQRGSIAARELGASQEELYTFTQLVGQGLAIQGGSAASATGALLQLSQALGSGVVRAEEFNSILEGAFPIAQAAARGLDEAGGSVARLRQLIVGGQVSSQEFFDALLSQAPELAATFATTVPTIGAAFTVLRNNVVRAFGEFNQATGASQGFARFILFIGQNAGTLIDILEAVAYALGVRFAIQGIGAAVGALRALAIAIATNPLGAIATVALAAGAAFVAFSDKIALTRGSSASAFDFISTAFGDLVGLIGSGVQTVLSWFGNWEDELGQFDFFKFVQGIATGIDAVIGLFYGLSDGVTQLFRTFPQVIGDLMISGLQRAFNAGTDFVNGIIRALNRIPGVAINTISAPDFVNPFENAAAAVGDAANRGFRRGMDEGLASNYVDGVRERAEAEAAASAAAAAEAAGPTAPTTPTAPGGDGSGVSRADIINDFNRYLDEQNMLLQFNSRERQIQEQLLQVNNALTQEGYDTLSAGESGPMLERLRNLQTEQELMDERERILAASDEQMRLYSVTQQALNQLIAEGAITQASFNEQMRQLQISMLETRIAMGEGSFADGFLLEIQRMLQGVENFRATAGQSFGQFFQRVTDGFANSVGRAIVYSENLGAAIQQVARSALAELISALVKLGIQWVINQTLGQTLATASTAASVAQAGVVASAWSPAATAVSLASYGANSPAAIAGMSAAYAAGKLFSSVSKFADGGRVSGPGGSRSDLVPALLSNDEFVVNAGASRRNAALLEAINNGATVTGAGGDITLGIEVNVNGDAGSNPERTGATIAREIEQALLPLLAKQMRPGGLLAGGR
jgi:tape measure domain-containing protein